MLNKALLVGRLTRDPELRTTASGISVCRFSVAVNRRFPKQGTNEYEVDFIDCVAWRQQAEFLSKWFKKGNLVSVEGEIQIHSYDDKDGIKRRVTEVIVDQIRFVEGKKASEQNNPYGASDSQYSSGNSYSSPPQNNAPAQRQVDLPNDISIDDSDIDLPF